MASILQKEESEWVRTNDLRRRLHYNWFDREILKAGEHPIRRGVSLAVLFICVVALGDTLLRAGPAVPHLFRTPPSNLATSLHFGVFRPPLLHWSTRPHLYCLRRQNQFVDFVTSSSIWMNLGCKDPPSKSANEFSCYPHSSCTPSEIGGHRD